MSQIMTRGGVIELIIMLVIGVAFLVIGWLIWKKRMVGLIHGYHRSKVSKKNVKPYAELMGKGTMVIGVGIILTGVIDLFVQSGIGWGVFFICFIWGLSMMVSAGVKYNR